jgi:hypothetical protein
MASLQESRELETMTAPHGRLRAFLSHSARAGAALAPILEASEGLLHELGWRTRLPRRPPVGTIGPGERRRLREESYRDIDRAALVLHCPAPARLSGVSLNRELHRAVQAGRPVLLLVCEDLRREHGIELPRTSRLEQLLAETHGQALTRFNELRGLLADWPATATGR